MYFKLKDDVKFLWDYSKKTKVMGFCFNFNVFLFNFGFIQIKSFVQLMDILVEYIWLI